MLTSLVMFRFVVVVVFFFVCLFVCFLTCPPFIVQRFSLVGGVIILPLRVLWTTDEAGELGSPIRGGSSGVVGEIEEEGSACNVAESL